MSTKKTPLKQLTLNFGQKSPKTTECKECGMIYNPNDKQDEQMHSKHHSDKESALKYTNLKGEKLVQEYPDGKVVVVEYGIDSKQSVNKAVQVLDYVDAQLGINENKSKLLADYSNKTSIKISSKFYLFVSNSSKKIVGFCHAEDINKSYKILYLNDNENTFSYDESSATSTAICGINRIWVAPCMRRNGVASRLLDCVRLNFIYIQKLEPNQLAFSDPTEFGRKLAKSYFKSDSFFIYNNCKND